MKNIGTGTLFSNKLKLPHASLTEDTEKFYTPRETPLLSQFSLENEMEDDTQEFSQETYGSSNIGSFGSQPFEKNTNQNTEPFQFSNFKVYQDSPSLFSSNTQENNADDMEEPVSPIRFQSVYSSPNYCSKIVFGDRFWS